MNHFQNSVLTSLLPESNFYLFFSFQSIWTVTILKLTLFYFYLSNLTAFWWWYSKLNVTILLALIKVLRFLQSFHPIDSYNKHTPEHNLSHSISVILGFPGPYWWHILKQILKAFVIKSLPVLDYFGLENCLPKNLNPRTLNKFEQAWVVS